MCALSVVLNGFIFKRHKLEADFSSALLDAEAQKEDVMKKVGIFIFATLLTIVLFQGGVAFDQRAASAAEPIMVKMNWEGPPSPPVMHTVSYGAARLAKKLEENSGGRLKPKIYWGGSLYKDDANQYAALKDNVIQICEVSGGRLGPEVPASFLPVLPFAFDNMDQVHRFLYGEPLKLFEAHYAERGYKLGAFWQYGFQNFVTTKRFLIEPADFKGMKMRIRESKLAASSMEAFGASAQAIPYMETYTALQLGTVDGAEIPLGSAVAAKWDEIAKYITMSRHSLLYCAILMNPAWYNGLPKDLQKIVDDTQKENAEFLFNYQEDEEKKMPWVMMSQQPEVQFKWLTEKQRAMLKKQTQSVWDEYKPRIPKDVLQALEETVKK
jgi:tripartite ATP-independent transporter DctP family solute receptor